MDAIVGDYTRTHDGLHDRILPWYIGSETLSWVVDIEFYDIRYSE